MPDDVTISLVIPTYQREQVLCATLRQVLELPSQPLEILVVDQTPQHEDATEAYLRSLADQITWIRAAVPGLPQARNLGLSRAHGDVILFVDDDVAIDSDLVAEHARCYRDETIVAVAGRVRSPQSDGQPPRRGKTGLVNLWSSMPSENWDSDQPSEVMWCTGGNMSARREALSAVGGFDEAYGVGAALLEDTDVSLLLRRSGRIVYCPQASIIHLAATTGGVRVPAIEDYVWSLSRNRAYFVRKHAQVLQRATSLARLAVTVASFTVRRRNPRILAAGLRGVRDAYRLPLPRPEGPWPR